MKHLTVMIVPYPGADVKSMKIRHRTLKLLGAAAVVLVCGLIAAVVYLRPVMVKARQYDRLQAENQLLNLEKQKIRELNAKIANLEQLVGKIHLAQGVGRHEAAASDAGEGEGEQEPARESYAIPLESSSSSDRSNQGKGDTRIPHGSPVDEKSYISRLYNPEIYHFGIDIALKQGTPIRATADGTVSVADRNEDLGFYVMVKHASGYSTLYAHNSRLAVVSGARVRRGDVIAFSGNLGQSSGPHLHYAIFDKNGDPLDPLPFLEP